jgi:hypothetical protein
MCTILYLDGGGRPGLDQEKVEEGGGEGEAAPRHQQQGQAQEPVRHEPERRQLQFINENKCLACFSNQ